MFGRQGWARLRQARRRGLCAAYAAASLLLLTHASEAATAPGTVVTTAVTATYGLEEGTEEASQSNAASFVVGRAGGVAIVPPAGRRTADRQEASCVFAVQIQNTGGASDLFDASFSVPESWSAVLVRDDNGDGQWQPSETAGLALPVALDAGQSVRCFLRVTRAAPPGRDETASVRLTSETDPAQSAVFLGTVAASPAVPGALRLGWRVQTGGPVLGEASVQGGVAYVGSDDGYLYAIAAAPEAGAAPGTVLWRSRTEGRVRDTPAVYTGRDGREQVSAGNDAGVLTTWDAATGQKRWSAFAGPLGTASWRARPLVSPDGGLVSVPGSRDMLWTLDTAQGALRRRIPWHDRTLAGDPAPTDADGGAWVLGTSGVGTRVQSGLPTRRVWLGGPAAGGLVTDTAQSLLIGVTAAGHVAAFDASSLAPAPHWPAGGGVDLNAGVAGSPALDTAGGLLYVAAGHAVYAVQTWDGAMGGAAGWPFAPRGTAGSVFRAAPLLWPTQGGGAPTLYVGDTNGAFYAVPTDRPDQASLFMPDEGAPGVGGWNAAPAASGTGAQDVVVAGNSNGGVYGFLLR